MLSCEDLAVYTAFAKEMGTGIAVVDSGIGIFVQIGGFPCAISVRDGVIYSFFKIHCLP